MVAFTWVQDSPQVVAGAQTISPTFGTPTTKGNLLIAYLTMGVSTSFGWSLPAGWVQGPSASNASGGNQAAIWYYINNPGGITSVVCNVTPTGTNQTIRGIVSEFNPGAGTVRLNGAGGTGTAGTVASVGVPLTGVLAGDLMVATFQEHFSAGTAVVWTPPTGFTVSGQQTTSSQYLQWGGYNLSAAAGGQTITGSSNTPATTTSGWAGAAAVFTSSTALYARGLVGAFLTQNPAGITWPATGTNTAAWEAQTGRTLTCYRSYQAMPSSVSADVTTALAAGQKVICSYKPQANVSIGISNLAPLVSASTQSTLDGIVNTFMTAMAAAAPNPSYVVIPLWVEPFVDNGIGGTGNSTFADLQLVFQHYYSIISAYGFKVAWVTSAGAGLIQNNEWQSYPGDAFCDIVGSDFYTGAYTLGSRISGYDPFGGGGGTGASDHAFNCAYFADNAQPRKPFAMYETGGTLRLPTGHTFTTTQFIGYVIGAMRNRAAQGLPNGDICWFNSGNDANNSPIVGADGTTWPGPTSTDSTGTDNGLTEYRNALFSEYFAALDSTCTQGLLI